MCNKTNSYNIKQQYSQVAEYKKGTHTTGEKS